MSLPKSFDLRSLEIFVAVQEAGSMTAAGEQLNMTQSAVSQAINALEDGLGIGLIDRTVRPMAPTPAGRALHDRARQLLNDADLTVDMVRRAANAVPPFLSIAMVDSFVAAVGPHLFKTFGEIAEQCRVWSGLSPILSEHFQSRRVDIIVTTEEAVPPQMDYTQFDLLTEPYLLVLPGEYDGPADDLESLSNKLEMVRFSERSNIGLQIEQHLRRQKLNPRRRMEFDFSDSVFSMVGAGAGWAIATPMCCLQAASYLPRVRIAPLPDPGLNRCFTLLVRDNQFLESARIIADASVSALANVLLPEIAKVAPWSISDVIPGPREQPKI